MCNFQDNIWYTHVCFINKMCRNVSKHDPYITLSKIQYNFVLPFIEYLISSKFQIKSLNVALRNQQSQPVWPD